MMLRQQEAAAAIQPFSLRGAPTGITSPKQACCRVPGCGADLAREKTYAQRKRLCAQHMQEFAVLLEDGAYHRFCFSCGKMHPLQCFDGKHRNCRAALLKRRQQGSGGRRNASPAVAAAPEQGDAAPGALTTEPSAAELQLGHSAPAIWGLLPPAVSASGSDRRRSSNGSSSSLVLNWLSLAGSAAAAPAVDEESALELLLETELAAAGLHELLAATGASNSRSSSVAPDDGRRRRLSWELASAVVENSLSQPESVAAAPCLLQRGPLDISGGYAMSSGPPAAAAPGSNAAGSASALGAPPQLAATAAGAWRHPVAADTPGSMAGSTVQQMACLGDLQAQMAALQSQMATMQARAHSLRQQLAMCPV